MTVRRLAAVDAQTYWMSAAIPNDEFLVYGFAGETGDLGEALEAIRLRAQRSSELSLRIVDTGARSYPVWQPCQVGPERFVVHRLADPTWAGCLAAACELADHQLDPRRHTWRLHVFPGVAGLPGAPAGTVGVLQISHALGDGMRGASLAAQLFGRPGHVPPVPPPPRDMAGFVRRSVSAARAHRGLVRDTEAGLVPPQAVSRPALRSNAKPSGRQVRSLIRSRDQLPGPTVTTGVLAAVSAALAGHLRELGDDPAQLAAEVPMAKAGPRQANNHFGNVTVGLFPELAREPRARAIAAELHQRRRRASHPAMRAESDVLAAMPAAVLRWGVQQFDPEVRSDTVAGNTVVSSVNRGAADLSLGGAPVVLTAGFPALSPMMGLTHGVHGIGDIIAISVHAAKSAVGDVDAYVDRLEYELR